MTECVIVAIPREDSQASRISSEKIAHMTLLYLGELDENTDIQMISEYVEHATSQIQPFGASVSHRGILGDDQADVLYLVKNELESMVRFRSYLLTNEQINRAYSKAYQHPSWTPHVTLGYPGAPAQPIEPTDRLHSYIEFDRIAVWYGDFEGPTFRMTHAEEVEHSMDDIEDFLAHYGVKGMRWGVRKSRDSGSGSGGRKKAAGDKDDEAPTRKAGKPKNELSKYSTDKLSSLVSDLKGPDALSDAELKKLTGRMQLEQSYRELKAKQPKAKTRAEKFLGGAKLLGTTANQLTEFMKSPAGKALQAKLASRAKK